MLRTGNRGGFIRKRAIAWDMGRELPPSAREALETLRQAVAVTDENHGIPQTQARTVLVDAGLDPTEINHLLELLENRGQIYFVGDEVRITEPDRSDGNGQT